MTDSQELDELRLETLKEALHRETMAEVRAIFLEAHQYDQAQMYQLLTPEERMILYRFLSPKELAEMFEIIEEDEKDVKSYLNEMDDRYVSLMLTEMFADNAVDLLKEMDVKEVRKYLRLMSAEDRATIQRLYYYGEDTAGSLMTPELIAIQSHQTVKSALTLIKELAHDAETIYYIYVVDEGQHLEGVLSLRDAIMSNDDTMVYDIMVDHVVTVDVNDDQMTAARKVQDYDFIALPVVDEENRIVGIITVDDVMDVLQEEASSEYSGLAAVDVESGAETTNPFEAAVKRLPWLITLLFLGMGTSSLISRYENLIAKASILSVFVTLITGTAGNAGTQSLAVAVRRLSGDDMDNDHFISIMLRELLTGLLTGLATGLTITLVVGIWQNNFMLGAIIGAAMLAAITVATLAGSFIPQLMEKIGVDPAVASGPFISTLSDLTSVLIYFSIASYFIASFLDK
ncbi:magnesium transporter [Atopobacter sp. AH10]|uniref:magnesium transporter n=1 Tax=Atopobacter sp. AH10 TaxID=2315861 RepID=UPI000EF24B94|nr:magnesium transporter [Atopobacter sp. AH10]RLK64200.1 magnesium transporter [Atopobacter sp. AH10]